MHSLQEYNGISFSPSLVFCPIFFHLGISKHVLGIFTGARGYVSYYETLCPLVLITWEVMGAKHNKVKKTGQRSD
jgi:hypothetical protein